MTHTNYTNCAPEFPDKYEIGDYAIVAFQHGAQCTQNIHLFKGVKTREFIEGMYGNGLKRQIVAVFKIKKIK